MCGAVSYTHLDVYKRQHGYYLTSLIRLSEDDCYINKIKELMESRAQKGKKDKYYNSRNKLWKGA